MATLQWSEALELGLELMDETHREFVQLLAVAESASDAEIIAAWDSLIEHTQRHFDQEDAWMEKTDFPFAGCHMTQHRVVLGVMRDGGKRLAEGDPQPVRAIMNELFAWFPHHAQTMDAALASHLAARAIPAATPAA